MRVIIDSDILRYQIGSIELENEYAFNPTTGSTGKMPAPPSEIRRIVDETIQHIRAATGATSYICVLSGKTNFRNDIANQQPYKGNREGFVKPYNWKTVGDHIMESYNHIVVDGFEADDWMGIEQRKDPENTIIASRDKDLKTVFGYHYRWACGERQPEVLTHWISEFDAKHFFFHQMLTGDTTDNICGCGQKKEMMWGGKLTMRRKGIGEKAAIQLLSDCSTVQELYDVVSQCYQNEFGDAWEEVMLENARLLYIGQTPDNLFDWSWLDFNLKKEELNVEENVCSVGSRDGSESSTGHGSGSPDSAEERRTESDSVSGCDRSSSSEQHDSERNLCGTGV